MHNCKSTINSLTDVALNELLPDQRKQLLSEMEECATCREEYASIRETLFVSGHALRSSVPPEEFWAGYHSRLVNRLENRPPYVSPSRVSQGPLQALWQMVTASVRIPVPVVAATLLLLFGVGTALAWNLMKRSASTPPVQAATVITKTVTVPVTREKIVTRVVYRERNNSRARTRGSQFISYPEQFGNALAQTGDAADKAPMSLVGFKPTEEVKLKVMKGTDRDER